MNDALYKQQKALALENAMQATAAIIKAINELSRIIDDTTRSAGLSDAEQRALTMGGWEQFILPNDWQE